jgi:hypothetical protein
MRSPSPASTDSEDREPLMLLALNSTPGVEWDELETKVRVTFAIMECTTLVSYREEFLSVIWQNH